MPPQSRAFAVPAFLFRSHVPDPGSPRHLARCQGHRRDPMASSQDAYKDLLPRSALDLFSVQKRQAFWREAIDLCEPQVRVAHLDGQVMGFVGFDRSRDKGTPATTGGSGPSSSTPSTGTRAWAWPCGMPRATACRKKAAPRSRCGPICATTGPMSFFEKAGFKRDLGSARTARSGWRAAGRDASVPLAGLSDSWLAQRNQAPCGRFVL